MAIAWTTETWYQKQTGRWDELTEAGWTFNSPDHSLLSVGITMKRGHWKATFYVPRMFDVEEIHTRLLEHCEQFAEMASST